MNGQGVQCNAEKRACAPTGHARASGSGRPKIILSQKRGCACCARLFMQMSGTSSRQPSTRAGVARRGVFQHAQEFVFPKPAHQPDVARLGQDGRRQASSIKASRIGGTPSISSAGATGTHCLNAANWLLAPVRHLCQSQSMRLALVAVRRVPLDCASSLTAAAAQRVAQHQPLASANRRAS